MANVNKCDLRHFSVGGPCIIRIDTKEQLVRGFWFGQIVSLNVIVDDDGATPIVHAKIMGGRLNRIGIPMKNPNDDAIPMGAYTVLPLNETTLALCTELDALHASYENETTSLRVSLEQAKKEARGMEHLFTKTFCELSDLKEKMGVRGSSATTKTASSSSSTDAAARTTPVRTTAHPASNVRGPGVYSFKPKRADASTNA